MKHRSDVGLDTLLELHNEVLVQDHGYWVLIQARLVEPSEHIPHGVRYSLTLHDRSGARVLGYDNAHLVDPGGRAYRGRILTYDHRHRSSDDQGVPYGFINAHQLLADFFADVDRVLDEVASCNTQ